MSFSEFNNTKVNVSNAVEATNGQDYGNLPFGIVRAKINNIIPNKAATGKYQFSFILEGEKEEGSTFKPTDLSTDGGRTRKVDYGIYVDIDDKFVNELSQFFVTICAAAGVDKEFRALGEMNLGDLMEGFLKVMNGKFTNFKVIPKEYLNKKEPVFKISCSASFPRYGYVNAAANKMQFEDLREISNGDHLGLVNKKTNTKYDFSQVDSKQKYDIIRVGLKEVEALKASQGASGIVANPALQNMPVVTTDPNDLPF